MMIMDLEKLLNAISTRAPCLEVLGLGLYSEKISGCRRRETIHLFTHYCKRLKFLRFIIDDNQILQDEENEKLFVECPSLSWIIVNRSSCVIFYNRFINKLRLVLKNFIINATSILVQNENSDFYRKST